MNKFKANNSAGKVAVLLILSVVLPSFARAQDSGSSGSGTGGLNGAPSTFNPSSSVNGTDPEFELMRKVRFDQNLNAQAPLDLTFRDETGQTVPLRKFFGARPVVMAMVYYHCTFNCSVVMHSMVQSLQDVPENVGKDFDVVAVSIDPHETSQMALANQREYAAQYGRPGSGAGFHFLTGDEANIKQLASAIGIQYAYDASRNEYAHPDGIVVLTPQGRVARYFYSVVYNPRDVRFGLMEASHGRIGTKVEQILLTCFHYDPHTGRYSASITNIVRLMGIVTVLAMLLGIGISLLREKVARRVKESDLPRSGQLPPGGSLPPEAKVAAP